MITIMMTIMYEMWKGLHSPKSPILPALRVRTDKLLIERLQDEIENRRACPKQSEFEMNSKILSF